MQNIDIKNFILKVCVYKNVGVNQIYLQRFVKSFKDIYDKKGKLHCPCKLESRQNICPCKDFDKDINQKGRCHCRLFVK